MTESMWGHDVSAMEGHYTVPVGKPTRISTQPRGLGASFDRVASYKG